MYQSAARSFCRALRDRGRQRSYLFKPCIGTGARTLPFSKKAKYGAGIRRSFQGGSKTEGNLHTIMCCAYCAVPKERNAVRTICSCEGVKALVPEKIKKEKRRGEWAVLRKRLFPGYVFIYGSDEEKILHAAVKAHLKLLRYTDGEWKLRDQDEQFARWILEHDGVAELSKAVNLGTRITVTEGPLAEMQGVVTQIDKRRQLMKVNLGINDICVWLSFDWAEPAEEDAEMKE